MCSLDIKYLRAYISCLLLLLRRRCLLNSERLISTLRRRAGVDAACVSPQGNNTSAYAFFTPWQDHIGRACSSCAGGLWKCSGSAVDSAAPREYECRGREKTSLGEMEH